ncbi:hypothetical protein [Vibrio phage PG216]|nr:hypothetical protein [Vibrio phage PG216]
MIDQTMSDYSRIMNAIEEYLDLRHYQYTDVIQYDKERKGFDVAIVEETENGSEYLDVFVPNERLETFL